MARTITYKKLEDGSFEKTETVNTVNISVISETDFLKQKQELINARTSREVYLENTVPELECKEAILTAKIGEEVSIDTDNDGGVTYDAIPKIIVVEIV